VRLLKTKQFSSAIPRHNRRMPIPKPAALPASIAKLAEVGVQRSYKKKSIIVSEGDSGDTVYILLEGSVRVFGQDAQGREVTYGNIDAPSYFGEMSLDGGPRSASIEASTACQCTVITRERIKADLAKNPELAFELITKIIARARSATDTVRSMALKDAYGRLREVLEELAGEPDDNGHRKIKAGTTHASLALRIGTSREMVSKILRDLEAGDYLASENRTLKMKKKLPTHW
jgi:CRP/FNR family transcriptional regulator, cyclic AMP receptor protein